jgi:hypothetical protein
VSDIYQYILDKAVRPQLWNRYLGTLPRWRRPLAILGRWYRMWTYERIENPWGWFVLRLLMVEYRTPRMQAREAYELSKSARFKAIETWLWAPVHYLLHPLAFRFQLIRLWRTWRRDSRKSWVKRASYEDKIKDWERRMRKAGPLPSDRPYDYDAIRRNGGVHPGVSYQVDLLPHGLFEPTIAAGTQPNGVDGWWVTLLNSAGEFQGHLTGPDGKILSFASEMEAQARGDIWIRELNAKRAALEEEAKNFGQSLNFGSPNAELLGERLARDVDGTRIDTSGAIEGAEWRPE